MTKTLLTLALLGGLTMSLAQESASTPTIDTQIEAIKAAPPSERAQLMNEFKQELMKMNQEERSAAIASMQEKMQSHGSSQAEDGQSHAEMMNTQAKEHSQELQMQTMQKMEQVQSMSHTQAGDQFQHAQQNIPSGGVSSGSTGTGPMGQNFPRH